MSGFTNSVPTTAAAIIVSALVLAVAMPASAQSTARIGTSSIGSALYTLTVGVARLMTEHAGINSSGCEWTVANTPADPELPFPAGVVRYFEQIGAWTPRNEKIQQQRTAR